MPLVIFAFIFSSWISVAQAQVVSAFVREQVGTLPQGRFLVSMVNLSSSIDTHYDEAGVKKPLASKLNQNISFQKIATEEKARTQQLSGLFRANGVNLSDSSGSLSGGITGTISGKVPVLGYGITDDLGIYVSVPILSFNIQSHYQFNPSASTQAFFSKLEQTDQRSVANDFRTALNTSLENKLWKSGYTWNPSLNRNYLGDVQVNLSKIISSKQLIQPILVLPTADDQDIHDLYGLKAGDRRFGLGLKYAVEKALPLRLQANWSASGTYLFANRQARRIPSSADDQVNENLDTNTEVSGGSKFASQAQLRYVFPKWVALNAGLLWQKKTDENLNGSLYSPDLYAMASHQSGYELWSTYASLDLNSIQSFVEGKFLFPAVAELGVGLPLAGRNSISEPVVEFQASMFF